MTAQNTRKNRLLKLIKWVVAILAILIISLFAIPSIFSDGISNQIKKGINENLETELQFKDSNISFFNHFPSLTFSFEDVNLAGSKPFEKDTLVTAKELGFGINIFKLMFSDKVVINETYLTDANIKLIKDKFGRNNYDIYTTSTDTITPQDTTSTGIKLNLRHLKIDNANIFYEDKDLGITVISKGLNYNGRGKINDGKIKLGSNLDMNNVDVVFDNIDYINGKKLKAKSLTIYDTENLSIELDKNTISLNDLDVNFHGKLDVFEDGFAYNLLFNTEDGTIEDVVTALPPQYVTWSKNVSLNGDLNAHLRLAGYTGTVPEASQIATTIVKIDIDDATIKHSDAEEAIKNLNLKFNGELRDNWMDFNLDTLNFTLNNEVTKGKILLRGKADSLYIKSNIISNINLDILNKTLNLPDLKFNGILATNVNVDGVYQPKISKLPKTNGVFKLSNGVLQTSGHPEPIKNIQLDAVAENNGATYAESSLTVNTFNFSFLNNQFTSQGIFKNFDNLNYDFRSKGKIDFTTLNQVVALPFLVKNGEIDANLKLKGQLNTAQNQNSHSGTLAIKNIEIKTDVLQYPVYINNGEFLFLNDKMAISQLDIKHQSSRMILDGFFQNYIDYALYDKGVLRGDVKLKSANIDITEFFPKEEQLQQQLDSVTSINSVQSVVSGVMQIPENVDILFNIAIDTLKYNSLNITKLSGNLNLKDEGLFLKNADLNMVDGTAKLDGFYQPLNANEALFSMDIKANNFNIEKGYNSMELFKELAPAAAQASGVVSVDYNLSGTLDHEMTPVLSALKGGGVLKVHSVKFDGYKLLGRISEKSGFDALNDPKVSEITIKSTVNNNVLELERFKFKVRPFKLRVEGQTTLDGEMSLKMRIGLPPLGLLGIPIVVKGTSDDFDIKLGSKSPDLSEMEDDDDTSYSEEKLQRMNMLKDSIREDMSVDQINKLQQQIESIKQEKTTTATDTLKVN
ncbi:hypothetical protein [Lacinutrix undariae]